MALRLWHHPRATRETIVAFQSRKLRQVVRHAYENVPYYRRLFEDAGCRPQEVRSIEDLAALPITTKAQLRAVPREDRLARGTTLRGIVRHLTSGSSGQPTEVWRSTIEERLLALFRVRAARQFGVRAGDRTAAISDAPLSGHRTLGGRLARAAALYRAATIDCRQSAEQIADQLEHAAPDVIGGFPNALAFVAPLVARRRPAGVRPRLILTGGEALALITRRRIEEGFDARVFDTYGVSECNVVAWECPGLGHLHVCDDSVVLEVLRDGAPVGEGETGEVVLTSLHSYTMPFIRYALGDVAVRGPEPCPCGQPFSTVRSVQGRVLDYFHLPEGRSIHPFAFTHPHPPLPVEELEELVEDWDWVRQHQLVQKDRDRVVLRILPLREPLPSQLERIQRRGDETVGQNASFRIELVEGFALGPGGKFQSYLPLPGDEHSLSRPP